MYAFRLKPILVDIHGYLSKTNTITRIEASGKEAHNHIDMYNMKIFKILWK